MNLDRRSLANKGVVFDGIILEMALFEQRFSEEQVRAARLKIADGSSLRSVAAEIGCAPSTLSVRIRKMEAAEARALARAGLSEDGKHGRPGQPDLPTIAGLRGAPLSEAGPLEVLRAAMGATKANGQPDWPTRLSAARAFATLCPHEVKPKTEDKEEPSIVVYDLPPGTKPVLHRPRERQVDAAVVDSEATSEPLQTSVACMYSFTPETGESESIGSWFPDLRGQSGAVNVTFCGTDDAETAERWRAELAAGQLPDQR